MQMAALRLREEEWDAVLPDFQKMLQWVQQLQKVDTRGVQPLANLARARRPYADDVPTPPMPRKEALANAPRHDGTYFQVVQKQQREEECP